MTPPTSEPSADPADREGRDSTGFARVVNLSDAVFAIAMTLLVLTVDVPWVPANELAGALLADLPQLGAYALAFALVASQWYAHRKLFERLAFTEPGLTVVNLVALGLVALVPFPTAVLGSYPTTTAAVAPFLAIFVALSFAYIGLIVRAHTVDAWTEPLPDGAYRRVVLAFLANSVMLVLGIVVSLWAPVAALVMAAVSSAPVLTILRTVPVPYRRWF